MISVHKDPNESLGMTVAGGASHREWDLPIYVISVEPGGVLSRDGRIKTGERGRELRPWVGRALGGMSGWLGWVTSARTNEKI